MRRILIENARRKKSLKYGGEHKRVDLDKANLIIDTPSDDPLALDEALTQLVRTDRVVADFKSLTKPCIQGIETN